MTIYPYIMENAGDNHSETKEKRIDDFSVKILNDDNTFTIITLEDWLNYSLDSKEDDDEMEG